MDIDLARDVIREQHRAVLTTLRQDGTPQMSRSSSPSMVTET